MCTRAIRALTAELVDWMQQLPRLGRDMQARIRAANRETIARFRVQALPAPNAPHARTLKPP